MNIEETKKCIEVMQAYVDGKEIEVKSFGPAPFSKVTDPVWDWYRNEYRVKPEPTYRPYANAEECFADTKKHGGWVKLVNINEHYLITSVSDEGLAVQGLTHKYDDILKTCDWADDGSPCGILEE